MRACLLQTWPDDSDVVPVPFSSTAVLAWLQNEDAEDMTPALVFEVLQVWAMRRQSLTLATVQP
jgi:hypothetical protein